MIKINLVAEGRKPVVAKTRKSPAFNLEGKDIGHWMLMAGILIGLLITGGWWFTLDRSIQANETDIETAEKQVKELQEIINQVTEFEKKEQELEHKIAVITELKNNQKGPVRIMDEVSRAVPELLWLDRFTLRGTNVSVSGRAFNNNAVANFITNLDQVPQFREPYLRDTMKRGSVYSFTVEFNFSPQPTQTSGSSVAPTSAGG